MHAAPSSAIALELSERPVTLRTGIGSEHDAVSTSSKQAQAFYDQGLAYLHSYVWVEAARSFHQALRLDSSVALAHLGLTIALAELNARDAAHAELERAKTLAKSDHDRRHVNARALQMAAEEAPGDAAKLTAYRAALDAALLAFPLDEQFWLQRGQAASPDAAERGQGSVAGSIAFYEKARDLAPSHFAAHHYLTHAYENTGHVEQALVEGQTYAKMAPAIPHARHMYGHDLRRAGRVTEAIAEFRAADALETDYLKVEKIPVEYDWHYQHNLDLLATSYQYIGQMRQAETLMRTSFAIPSSLVVQEFNKREWPMFLLGRGRATEALAAANVMAGHRSPIVSAAGHVEAGRAQLALGQFKEAADEGNAALQADARHGRGRAGSQRVAIDAGRIPVTNGTAGQGAPDARRCRAQGARGARSRCLEPDAVLDRSDREGCARSRRLGFRRLGGGPDA